MSDQNDAVGVRNKVGNFLTRRPKSLLSKILIALLIVLPLAGSAVYMWSMWNPTEFLRKVPIAVVNMDAGADQNGKSVNFGNDVVDGLKAEKYLQIHTVSKEEAHQGLLEDRYLFTLAMPEDFSKDILTVIDPEPKKARIDITYNDYNGTSGAFLTAGLVPQLSASIAKSIGEGYASEILVGMNQLHDGLAEAADGAGQLDDGAGQLRDGAHQLADGADQLTDGTHQLGDGMKQISGGVDQLVDLLVPLLTKVGNIAPQLQPIANVLLKSGIPDIVAQGKKLQSFINDFNNENPQAMVNQLKLLKDGAREVSYNLNDPKAPYLGGMLQLQDGAHQLADGTDQLKDGTQQLRTGLTDGADQAPTIKDLKASSNQIVDPFVQNEKNHYPSQVQVGEVPDLAPARGTSLLFVVVMSFLLMAIMSMLLPASMGRRYDSTAKNATLPILKAACLSAVVGMVVAGIFSFLSTGIGWKPTDVGAMVGIVMLIGATAGTIYLFWRTLFGRLVGGIAALVIFMLGLFSFGGTWPLSTTPALFRALHPVAPMSYARDIFTLGTMGNYNGTFTAGVIAMFVFIVLSVLGTMLVRYFQLAATTPEALEEKAKAIEKDKALPVTA